MEQEEDNKDNNVLPEVNVVTLDEEVIAVPVVETSPLSPSEQHQEQGLPSNQNYYNPNGGVEDSGKE
jgi:hypothetical protein